MRDYKKIASLTSFVRNDTVELGKRISKKQITKLLKEI